MIPKTETGSPSKEINPVPHTVQGPWHSINKDAERVRTASKERVRTALNALQATSNNMAIKKKADTEEYLRLQKQTKENAYKLSSLYSKVEVGPGGRAHRHMYKDEHIYDREMMHAWIYHRDTDYLWPKHHGLYVKNQPVKEKARQLKKDIRDAGKSLRSLKIGTLTRTHLKQRAKGTSNDPSQQRGTSQHHAMKEIQRAPSTPRPGSPGSYAVTPPRSVSLPSVRSFSDREQYSTTPSHSPTSGWGSLSSSKKSEFEAETGPYSRSLNTSPWSEPDRNRMW